MANVSFKGSEGSLENDDEEYENIFEIEMTRHQKRNSLYHIFLNHMPTVTKECISSSEYYFEEGLRKVR